jgi:hypothetical protein
MRSLPDFRIALLPTLALLAAGCTHAPVASGPATDRRTAGATLDETDPHPVRVVDKLETPAAETCHSLSYRGFSTKLDPGDGLELGVPKSLQSKPIAFVILGHGALSSYGDWDKDPALTSLQFRWTKDGTWRYWGGPSSGAAGAKFAEYRGGGLELEGLYEWGHYGHYDLDTRKSSNAPLRIDRIRAVSTGADPVLLGEVSVIFWPSAAASTKEYLFTPGTNFGSYVGSDGASYYLDYATAWELGSYASRTDSSGAELKGGVLRIPLPAGKKLGSVEVACGDAPQGSSYPGGASLSIRVRHSDGSSESWKEYENVPPSGILKAAAPKCDSTVADGDVLEILGSGQMWVMGARLGFL